ncbi:MAG: Kelch repeat-containing protein, partial [Thiobacillus sp.]
MCRWAGGECRQVQGAPRRAAPRRTAPPAASHARTRAPHARAHRARHSITFDAPGIQPNYNPNVHIHSPRLPTLSRWRRVATRGDPPPPRFGHTAVVTGAPGGLGAQRHALLVFGGRGTTGPLNDAWELSLEGVPPYQPEVQALVCHT